MDTRSDPALVVKAWTDPIARALLDDDARATLPPSPAGDIALPELPADESTDEPADEPADEAAEPAGA